MQIFVLENAKTCITCVHVSCSRLLNSSLSCARFFFVAVFCYCRYCNNVAVIFTILRAGEIHLGTIIKKHFPNLPLCE